MSCFGQMGKLGPRKLNVYPKGGKEPGFEPRSLCFLNQSLSIPAGPGQSQCVWHKIVHVYECVHGLEGNVCVQIYA